jgi:hypothetical protein
LICPWLLAVIPLLPLRAICFLPLAAAGTSLHLVHSRHLIGAVPVIRPIISSLSPEVGAVIPAETGIAVIDLLGPAWFCRHQRRLCRIAQCISIGYLDGFRQRSWHISL